MIKNDFPKINLLEILQAINTKKRDDLNDSEKDIIEVFVPLLTHLCNGHNIIYWTSHPCLDISEEVFNDHESQYNDHWHDIKFHCCIDNENNYDLIIEPQYSVGPADCLKDLIEVNTLDDDIAFFVGSIIKDLLDSKEFNALHIPAIGKLSSTSDINETLSHWLTNLTGKYHDIKFTYKPLDEKSEVIDIIETRLENLYGEIALEGGWDELPTTPEEFFETPKDKQWYEEHKEECKQYYYKWLHGEITFNEE